MVTISAPAARERLRRDPGGGAVRLVEDDLQPFEAVGEDGEQMLDVPRGALVVRPDAPDARTGGPVPGRPGAVLLVHALDPVLQIIGELVPAAGEELDAVVGHGVVAGGEHHAEVGAQLAGEERHRGGGQHTDAQHVDARTGEAYHDGRLQELSGRSRIPPDHRHRLVALEGSRLGEYVCRRDGESERELGRQIRVGDTAHAVGAEESSHCGVLRIAENVRLVPDGPLPGGPAPAVPECPGISRTKYIP